jgi:hypothetical protein
MTSLNSPELSGFFGTRNAIPSNDRESPGTPNDAYRQMEIKWDLPRDLLGGTLQMRDAATKWLPKETEEQERAYQIRLARTILYNAYGDTIDKHVAKPFVKPVTEQPADGFWSDEQHEEFMSNVDFEGSDLTKFTKQLFFDMLVYGKCHIYVDFPVTRDTPDGPKLLKSEEKQHNIRPYFSRISPLDLIGWKAEKIPQTGADKLTEIRIREVRDEPDGDFQTQEVVYIRVIRETEWELHKEDPESRGNFILEKSGVNTLGKIPLTTAYAKQVGLLESEPPFADLAWLNLVHFQSDSDQRNILRFTRFGLLVATGVSEEEIETGLAIGPNRLITLSDAEAKLTYVEHNGSAIGAGTEDLEKIEQRMEILGLQPLIARVGTETATGRKLDKIEASAEIQSWIRQLEQALERAFELIGEWLKKIGESPVERVDIFSDFAIIMGKEEDVKFLLELHAAELLPDEDLLEAYKRRGILPEDADVDDMLKRAKKQAEERAEREPDMIPSGELTGEDEDDEEEIGEDEIEIQIDEGDAA